MKKLIYSLALLIAVAFVSCNNDDGLLASKNGSQKVSSIASTYKKIVGLQLDYAQKGVDAVNKYIDIPQNATTRGYGEETIDMNNIGDYLPADLSTLKRKRTINTRAYLDETEESEGEEEEEVSLEIVVAGLISK
jgi:hypothetical protein